MWQALVVFAGLFLMAAAYGSWRYMRAARGARVAQEHLTGWNDTGDIAE